VNVTRESPNSRITRNRKAGAASEPLAARLSRRLRPLALLGALSVVVALARLHTYDEPLERDITGYAVAGHALLGGQRLYSDVWDHKPPAIHATYALAEVLAGYGYAPIYLMGVVAAIATLFGVYKAASAFGGAVPGIWASAFWALLCSDLYLQANQPNTEVFINALLVWALALLVCADRHSFGFKKAVITGILLALASVYKQVVVVNAALLCLVHPAFPPQTMHKRSHLLGQAALMAAVGAATWATVLGYFAATGRFSDFYENVVVYNSQYAGSIWSNIATSWQPALLLPNALKRVALPLIAVSLIGAGVALATSRISGRCWMFLVASMIATQAAVALPGKFFAHYYQLWVPLLAVCAGIGVNSLRWVASKGATYWSHTAGATVLVLLLGLQLPLYRLAPEDWSRRKYGEVFVDSQRMGREIGSLLKPGETFFEWGAESGLYFDSQREPSSGILAPVYLLFNRRIGAEVSKRLIEDLARRPPELFVVHRPNYSERMRTHPVIAWFSSRYKLFPHNPVRGRFILLIRRGGALEARLKGQAPSVTNRP